MPTRLARLRLFPTRVHVARFEASSPAFNAALVARALMLYERCWKSQPEEAVQSALPGGWRTAANMLFFRQQLSFARERGYREHLAGFEGNAEWSTLLQAMRGAAESYLSDCGAEDASVLARDSPLFVWASIHTGGSCHPPHVHSDACVTGTYYARRPEGAAPLTFEDPRGMSPHDVVAGLESRLRYGDAAGAAAAAAVPPFDRGHSIEPAVGDCVLFPPWLVHSVPPTTPDECMRVSFSFNLLGGWKPTASVE